MKLHPNISSGSLQKRISWNNFVRFVAISVLRKRNTVTRRHTTQKCYLINRKLITKLPVIYFIQNTSWWRRLCSVSPIWLSITYYLLVMNLLSSFFSKQLLPLREAKVQYLYSLHSGSMYVCGRFCCRLHSKFPIKSLSYQQAVSSFRAEDFSNYGHALRPQSVDLSRSDNVKLIGLYKQCITSWLGCDQWEGWKFFSSDRSIKHNIGRDRVRRLIWLTHSMQCTLDGSSKSCMTRD